MLILSTTVVNNITNNLLTLGLSEYEAKAYIALLEKNPATAYEVAKSSGIPTSKIYEVLSRLAEKGFVSHLLEDSTKRYTPMDAHEFIKSHRSRIETTLNSLEDELPRVRKVMGSSNIWSISDYEYLMDRAGRMILEAQDTLLISAWRDEIENLYDFLKTAEIKDVRIAIIHFGRPWIKAGRIFQHPVEDTIYLERGERGLVIVSDSKEVLMSTILKDGSVEGAWSMNRGFVTLAEDYIKHDIYIMKIVRRFDSLLRRVFGNKYEDLRDLFGERGV